MRLRDQIENILRSWNIYEKSRSSPAIIDFDCAPNSDEPVPATSRLAVARQLESVRREAQQAGETNLAANVNAHLAYAYALLGDRPPLDVYIMQTQGCRALGWPEAYVASRGILARKHLSDVGIDWGPETNTDLNALEGFIDLEAAIGVIHQTMTECEPQIRRITHTTAPYELDIITVDEDAYWAYWLDGAGQRIRLRLNLHNARFTKVQARQLTLHEILSHGLQSASYTQQCIERDVPWIRLLSVHAPQQIMLEGLAQAMPLFLTPDDPALVARVYLVHYTQLVRAELHLAVNAGVSIEECVHHARSRVPFWSDETIADFLADRSNNVLLRSYLWAYPAGIDWFVRLAEDGGSKTIRRVLQAAYRDPLLPDDLVALWPEGPTIGGSGESVDT